MSHGGKGDLPRPFSVTPEEFAANHERIFGKRPPRPRYVPPPLPDKMEGARRALRDCTDFGIGSYRQHADGTTELHRSGYTCGGAEISQRSTTLDSPR